jgi:glycopeptide antibiotics resistance protein
MNYTMFNRNKLRVVYKEAPYFQPLIATLVIYLVFVYLLTLNPFRFSLFHFERFIQFKRGYLAAIIGGSSFSDIILNLFMLFPLGLVAGSLFRNLQIKFKVSLITATALGFSISLSIELCQVFLPRSFSGVDIFANTVGTAIGAMLAYPIKEFDTAKVLKKLYDQDRSFYTRVVIIYIIAATVILMLPISMNTFGNWNSNFHLGLGNEATLNRPWNGFIYKLSIFNRKLTHQQAEKFSTINFKQETPAELSNKLLVEYIFANPGMKKFGALKDNLDLNLPQNCSFVFNVEGGIILKDNSYISTSQPAFDLTRLLKKTNQLSIAIWFQPANLQQDGPARIVSLSTDTDHRNFTLGQFGSKLNFRVRTPLNGLNGSRVELTTHPIITADKPQFIIAMFHRGEMKLYYNGKIVPSIIYDTSYYLPLLAGLGNNRFGKAAFCFMLLFPLGWLARGLLKFKTWKSIISSIIALVPFLILSSVTIIFLKHTFDRHLFYLCFFVSLLLLVIGLLYEFLFVR